MKSAIHVREFVVKPTILSGAQSNYAKNYPNLKAKALMIRLQRHHNVLDFHQQNLVEHQYITKLSHSPVCSIVKRSQAEVSFIISFRPPTHPGK